MISECFKKVELINFFSWYLFGLKIYNCFIKILINGIGFVVFFVVSYRVNLKDEVKKFGDFVVMVEFVNDNVFIVCFEVCCLGNVY